MSTIERLHRTRVYPTLRVESDPAGSEHWMYMHSDIQRGTRPCFRTALMDDMWSFLNSITLREGQRKPGALRHVDKNLVEAGRAFGLRGTSLFLTVQLPAVLPSVIGGLRLALAQSWLFLVAAELIASAAGLGFLLIDSQNNGRVDNMLLAIILLAVFGKSTDALLGVFERRAIRRWT